MTGQKETLAIEDRQMLLKIVRFLYLSIPIHLIQALKYLTWSNKLGTLHRPFILLFYKR